MFVGLHLAPVASELAGFMRLFEDRYRVDGLSRVMQIVAVAASHHRLLWSHPFLDGNGRIGRLLIAALFEHWGLLAEPLMYLSGYLKQHQAEYYRRLSAIRTEGDWESWVTFFLEGVATAAGDAEKNIIEVASLVAADRRRPPFLTVSADRRAPHASCLAS